MKRKVIVSLNLSCDYTEMLQEMEADLGYVLEGEELREYFWESFSDSLGALLWHINKNSIDITINEIIQP